MIRKPPKAYKVIIPQPYRASFDTDIRKTIKAEQKRLAGPPVVRIPTPVILDPVVSGPMPNPAQVYPWRRLK